MPVVSIIMAAYNSAEFIGRAIDSVINQTISDWELIIIDDCSQDKTATVALDYCEKDQRIIYTRTDRNSGPSHARNVGMSLARGTWITILDSDDTFLAERLERLVTIAEADQLNFIADNIVYFDKYADEIIGNAYQLPRSSMELTIRTFLLNCGAGRYFSFSLLKPLVRLSLLKANGIRYDETIRVGEDFHFIFSILWNGARAAVLSEALYVYTLPFGLKSRRRSSTTRTDYSVTGWDAIVSAKLRVLDYAVSSAPDRQVEIAALTKLIDAYRGEQNWQMMKQHFRSRNFHPALSIAMKNNTLGLIAKKLYYRFSRTQRIYQ